MKWLIISLIFLFCSCDCPNNESTKPQSVSPDYTVLPITKCYKVKNSSNQTLTTLYEVEFEGHLYILNTWNDYRLEHALHCPCQKSIEPTFSIFQ